MSDIDADQVAALLASADRAALDVAARDWNAATLTALADGKTLAWTTLHTLRDHPGLVISGEARQAAADARELRAQGHATVAGTLALLGFRFAEPVNILPHAIPGVAGQPATLGLVNNHEGLAVATSVPLPRPVVDALSGTCGDEWRSRPGRVQWEPDGWIALGAGVTGDGARPEGKVTARIAWWCLPVTYGEPVPGWTALRGQGHRDRMEPQDWEPNGTGDAMNAAGRAALLAIARELAVKAGCVEDLERGLDPDRPVAWEVPPPARAYFSDTAFASAGSAVVRPDFLSFPRPAVAEQVLDQALGNPYGTSGPCAEAAAAAGVRRLARACEAPLGADLIAALLGRLAWDALLPVARALAASAYPGALEPDGNNWAPVYARRNEMTAALKQLARKASDAWLREVLHGTYDGDAASLALREMGRIYCAGAPVAVDIPLPVPGHLAYPGDEPVGLAEIRARLHRKRGTVDRWRQRDVLPVPDWPSVGGRPAWKWRTIAAWWAVRGIRLPDDDAREEGAEASSASG